MMTEKYVDTAIGTLPMWAAYTHECYDDPDIDPIDGWLRLTDADDRVRIVPAEWDADKGELRPMDPPPCSVFHTREEAEEAVRRALADRWRRERPELLGWVDGLPAAERTPVRLRQRLAGYDRIAAAATDQRTAYDALVRCGYITEGGAGHTVQVPCTLTVTGRELAGLDDEEEK